MERQCRKYSVPQPHPPNFGNANWQTDIYFLGFFEKQLEKSEINTRALTTATYYARARSAQEIDDLEERLREHEVRILQMNNSHEKLQRKYLQLTELRHVLRETAVFFEQVRINVAYDILNTQAVV